MVIIMKECQSIFYQTGCSSIVSEMKSKILSWFWRPWNLWRLWHPRHLRHLRYLLHLRHIRYLLYIFPKACIMDVKILTIGRCSHEQT